MPNPDDWTDHGEPGDPAAFDEMAARQEAAEAEAELAESDQPNFQVVVHEPFSHRAGCPSDPQLVFYGAGEVECLACHAIALAHLETLDPQEGS